MGLGYWRVEVKIYNILNWFIKSKESNDPHATLNSFYSAANTFSQSLYSNNVIIKIRNISKHFPANIFCCCFRFQIIKVNEASKYKWDDWWASIRN